MSGPTNSSSAPDAEVTEQEAHDPTFIMHHSKVSDFVRIKCTGECNAPTFHDAYDMFVMDIKDPAAAGLPVGQIRVMTCTECGKIKTTK